MLRRNCCWRSYSEFDQSEDDDVGETHVGGVLSLGGTFGEMLVEEMLVEEMLVGEVVVGEVVVEEVFVEEM